MAASKSSGNIQLEEAGSKPAKKNRGGFCCGLFAFILYIFLFILTAIGIGILAISLYAYFDIGHFTFLYAGIALGGLIVIVCLLNIIAVCSRSKIMVIIIFLILGGLVAMELYIAAKGVNISNVDSSTEFSGFWGDLSSEQKTSVQKVLKCCGLNSTDEDPQTCPEGVTQTCTQAIDDYISKFDTNAKYIMYGAVVVEGIVAAFSFLIVFCSC